jgi:hypothetical protein
LRREATFLPGFVDTSRWRRHNRAVHELDKPVSLDVSSGQRQVGAAGLPRLLDVLVCERSDASAAQVFFARGLQPGPYASRA